MVSWERENDQPECSETKLAASALLIAASGLLWLFAVPATAAPTLFQVCAQLAGSSLASGGATTIQRPCNSSSSSLLLSRSAHGDYEGNASASVDASGDIHFRARTSLTDYAPGSYLVGLGGIVFAGEADATLADTVVFSPSAIPVQMNLVFDVCGSM